MAGLLGLQPAWTRRVESGFMASCALDRLTDTLSVVARLSRTSTRMLRGCWPPPTPSSSHPTHSHSCPGGGGGQGAYAGAPPGAWEGGGGALAAVGLWDW